MHTCGHDDSCPDCHPALNKIQIFNPVARMPWFLQTFFPAESGSWRRGKWREGTATSQSFRVVQSNSDLNCNPWRALHSGRSHASSRQAALFGWSTASQIDDPSLQSAGLSGHSLQIQGLSEELYMNGHQHSTVWTGLFQQRDSGQAMEQIVAFSMLENRCRI